MKKINQKIKCDVDSCKYNDCSEKRCQLNEIKISCDYRADCKDETICDSFEKNKE